MGHFGAALAFKRAEKRVSLGWLFLATQLLDILFMSFVLLGVERLRIVENFTPSTHFELEFYPYTHGLVGSLVWAAVGYVVAWLVSAKEKVQRSKIALVIAATIFSHWVLDLIVHTPDLPLLGDDSPKLGLGLWNYAVATFVLEALLLLAGLWLYLRGTKAEKAIGKYGMIAFVVALIALNAYTIFGPPPESPNSLAVSLLVLYPALSGIAFWLNQKRS